MEYSYNRVGNLKGLREIDSSDESSSSESGHPPMVKSKRARVDSEDTKASVLNKPKLKKARTGTKETHTVLDPSNPNLHVPSAKHIRLKFSDDGPPMSVISDDDEVDDKPLTIPPNAIHPYNLVNSPEGWDLKTTTRLADVWDPFPDGPHTLWLSHKVYESTKNLVMNWSMLGAGGYPNRSADAPKEKDGKPATRTCLGIILCTTTTCKVVIRPVVDKDRRVRQLEQMCQCGGSLVYYSCPGKVKVRLITWRKGVTYTHNNFHFHPRPTHEVHLSPRAEVLFSELVTYHPTAKPMALVVGLPTIHGPHGPSVAEIAAPLVNAKRVVYEKKKLQRGNPLSGSNFLKQFSLFKVESPAFVVQERFDGGLTVISLQTQFMKEQLAKDPIADKPLNGLVSDGAHGWFADRNEILIVSSTYSLALLCWVPVLFSYSDGASADHFAWHFLALFKSIYERAQDKDIAALLLHFATVCNFVKVSCVLSQSSYHSGVGLQ